jgi:multidrug resistance efflux pump
MLWLILRRRHDAHKARRVCGAAQEKLAAFSSLPKAGHIREPSPRTSRAARPESLMGITPSFKFNSLGPALSVRIPSVCRLDRRPVCLRQQPERMRTDRAGDACVESARSSLRAFCMNLRQLRLPLALLAAALLAACSNSDTPATNSATTPAYAAIARGRIDIEGGLLKLSMLSDGVVQSVDAHEGEHVQKGQLLVQLDPEPAKLALDSALAEQQQAQAQSDSLDERVKAADLRASRLEQAAKAGAGDTQSADDAREAAQQVHAELANAHASLALAGQKVAGARYQLALRSLRAPIDGQIVQRMVQPGASVSPAAGPVFLMLPDAPRIVRAELNESFVGVVHDGMTAEVDDDSGSGMAPMKAHVLRIGNVFGASTLEDDPQVRANTRTVECVLTFDQAPTTSLRIGQRVVVKFGQNTAAY